MNRLAVKVRHIFIALLSCTSVFILPMNFPVEKIFSVKSDEEFNEAALAVFHYQLKHCSVYREYVEQIKINSKYINSIYDIPFLPVEFFKTQKILSDEKKEELIFLSSGTTATMRSRHFIADKNLYIRSLEKSFEMFYGDTDNYCLLALLPSYIEQENSSLVFMVDTLVKKSFQPGSGFYPNDYENLFFNLRKLISEGKKIILLGVSYALLDFAEKFSFPLRNVILMETGGMKGRREEITRQELHQQLCNAFQITSIHSEYGMTELLSQAYSKGSGIFRSPPWMKIILRNPDDPLDVSAINKNGIINVIDLANIFSCSFIATQDLGRKINDGSFEVIGRTDYSDARGCNLMVSDF